MWSLSWASLTGPPDASRICVPLGVCELPSMLMMQMVTCSCREGPWYRAHCMHTCRRLLFIEADTGAIVCGVSNDTIVSFNFEAAWIAAMPMHAVQTSKIAVSE